MIYHVLRLIVKVSLKIFFRKIILNKKHELPEEGPLIIVVNHPNTFMDPLIVATLFKRKVGFLGNASIFINAIVNGIFRYFNVIPVYRQKDIPEGEKPDNRKTFSASNKYLEEGNALMIFPEGNSYHELKLRKIKTGTARIALSTEEINNFELGLKILPVGLYYSNPSKFRSKIYVNVDQAFEIKDFKQQYALDEFTAVQALTEKIKEKIEQNVIETEDKEQEDLFIKLKRVYKRQLRELAGVKSKTSEEFEMTRELAKAIQYFKVNNERVFAQIKEKVEQYVGILDEIDVADIANKRLIGKGKKFLITIGGALYALVGFPLYLFGALQNYLPFNLPYWTARTITKEIEYHAPIMLSVGIITFPLFYYIFGYTFYGLVTDDILLLTGYIVLLPLSGFYCLHYSEYIQTARTFIKLNSLFRDTSQEIQQLQELKAELTWMLNEARESYLKRL